MAQAKGYKTKTVIDFESSFKVAPTTKAGKIMPFNSNTVAATQNLNSAETITGTRNPVQPFKGNVSVDGNIVVPNDYNAIGYVLKAMFGAPTTTKVGTQYKHVFKIGDEQPSIIIEKQFPDIGKYVKYTGCKISSLSLPFGGDGESTITLSVMGATEEISGAEYDAAAKAVALKRAENFQCHVVLDDSERKSIIREGTLTIDCGLDGNQYCIGDEGTRGDIPESIVSANVEMTALFKDTEFIDKAVDGTVTSLAIQYTNGTDSLEFKFAEGLFERQSPAIDGPSGVVCDANFKAFYGSDANKSAVVVTLVNSVTGY